MATTAIKPKRYAKKTTKKRVSQDLSSALSDTLDMVEVGKGQLNFELLPISKIELDVNNPRELFLTKKDLLEGVSSSDKYYEEKKLEKTELESISESIKKYGVLNPITVYREGKIFKLIAGERRTLSSILAGKTHIPAKIISDYTDPTSLSVLQWIENIERKDLSLWEKIRNLQKIVKVSNIEVTGTKLKEVLKCEKTQAYAYAAVLNNLNPTLEKLIQDDVITSVKKAMEAINWSTDDLKKLSASNIQAKEKSQKAQFKSKKTKTKKSGKKITIETSNSKVAKYLFDSLQLNEDLEDVLGMLDEPNWLDVTEINRYFSELTTLIEKS